MPNKIYNVLHVDDDNNHLKISKLFLEHDKKLSVTSIDSPVKALETIPNSNYECIITDYKMPEMDGITFAKKALELCDLPIIIYTGQGSEEVAQAAFAAGISDYFRKEIDPSHYQVISKRIIDAIEKRYVEDSYRKLFENANDAIYIHDHNGNLIDVNEAACRRLSVSREELLKSSLNLFVSPQGGLSFNENLAKLISKGSLVFQSTNTSSSGKEIPVEVSARTINYRGIPAILSYSRDISDRISLEKLMKTRLEALQDHAHVLSQCEDVYTVAKVTYDILHEVMGYSFFGLGIIDGDTLKFIPNLVFEDDWPSEYSLPGPGICARAVETGSSIIIPDVRLETDYIGPKTGYRYLSEMAIPVKYGGKVVALINVEDEKPNRFTRDDVALLEIFSEHVAASLHRIALIQSTRNYLSRLEQINRHASQLINLNSVEEIVEHSFDVIEKILGIIDGSIGVIDGNTVKFLFSSTISEIPTLSLDGAGISVRAIKTGKSQLVNDVRLDPDYVVSSSHTLSELDVPIRCNNKVFGVINLEADKTCAFSEEDRTILEILSEHMGSAINRIEDIKKIKLAESTYKKLLESSLDPILIISGLEMVFLNKQAVKLSGYDSESDLLGKDISIILPEEDRKMIIQRALSRQRGEPQPDRYIIRLLRKGGDIIEVEVSVTLLDFGGQSSALIIARDITPRIHDENRIMALQLHAASLAQAIKLEDVHKATLDAVESVIGYHLLSFLRVEKEGLTSIDSRGAPPFKQHIPLDGRGITAKAAREKRSVLVKDTRGDPDFLRGTTDSLSELAVPVVIDGETVAVINMESLHLDAFDEKDQKLVETLAMHVASAYQRISESERQLENVSRLGGMVRHDLMGPLQVISNATYLLRHNPEEVEDMAKIIDNNVDYSVKILDDLRTVTKHRELVKSQVDLAELIDQSLAGNVRPQSVKVERAYTGPVNINADSTSIRRCIDNLIKNAVEAMPQGGVLAIAINIKDNSVEFTIKDTGKGLSAEVMKSLFKPFFSTKSSGRGLGLAFSKNAVEAHGGQITVESRVNEGAIFTVMLPT